MDDSEQLAQVSAALEPMAASDSVSTHVDAAHLTELATLAAADPALDSPHLRYVCRFWSGFIPCLAGHDVLGPQALSPREPRMDW